MMCTDAKAMPNNDTDYSCHLKAVEFVHQSFGVYITPYHAMVINIVGGRHTQRHTHIHTYMHTQMCA